MRFRLRMGLMFLTVPFCLPLTAGCIGKPGGFHTEPEELYFDEPIVLEFKHIIRGSGGRGAAVRYSDEKVFYRVGSDSSYKPAKVTRTHANRDEVVDQATIPPI